MHDVAVTESLPSVAPSHQTHRFAKGAIEVKVREAKDLDESLNHAVMLLLQTASQKGTGILVSRISVGRYVVQACPDVPVGLTRERYV